MATAHAGRVPANQLHLLTLPPPALERLSTKSAAWSMESEVDSGSRSWTWENEEGTERQPLPQEMTIRLVGAAPALRWLRSKLSEEIIATLKQERPEVAFIS